MYIRAAALTLLLVFLPACTTDGPLFSNTMGKAAISVCEGTQTTGADGARVCEGKETVQESDHVGPEFAQLLQPLVAALARVGAMFLPAAVMGPKPAPPVQLPPAPPEPWTVLDHVHPL